ncbi:nucleolar transcription factor 1-A-like [Haliotis cracherodii]|uniref:nucleolar transcription factor 1-A-like n=1 Tax=Haliotis cracherodii TaxID=6455 RepID=UPI0039ECB31A
MPSHTSKKRRADSEVEDTSDVETSSPKKKKKTKEKVDERNRSDPAEWPAEDILQLFERMEGVLPKPDLLRYTRCVEKINWEDVQFGEYSSQDCADVFNLMLKRVRLNQTATDLLNNMKCMYGRQPRLLQGQVQRMPKKPSNIFTMFIRHKQKKIRKKNPNLTGAEVLKILASLYKNLSAKKKQKYQEQYNQNMEAYKEEFAKFKEEYPELVTAEMKAPKCVTPLSMFLEDRITRLMEADPELNHKEASEAATRKWKKLKEKKLLKWIRRAVKAFEEDYKPQCAVYQRVHPTFVSKSTCLKKSEQNLLDIAEGKPVKPPQSGLGAYQRCRWAELKDSGKSFRHIGSKIIREWKQMSAEEKDVYNMEVKQAKTEYAVAYNNYLLSLSPEKRQMELRNKKGKIPAHTLSTSSDDVNGDVAEDEVDGTTGIKEEYANNIKHMEPLRSALSYYIEEQCKELIGNDSDTSESDLTVSLTKQFKKLPEDEKDKYRKMAESQRKQTLMTNFISGSPKSKPKPLSDNGAGKNGAMKSFPGEPTRPPLSGYSLFSTKLLSELTDVPSNERMGVIGQRWKQLSEEEKTAYSNKVKKKMQKYTKEVEKFKEMATHQSKMRWSAGLDIEHPTEVMNDLGRKTATCLDQTSVKHGSGISILDSIGELEDVFTGDEKCLRQRRVSSLDTTCDRDDKISCTTNLEPLSSDESDADPHSESSPCHQFQDTALPPSIIVQCREIYRAFRTDHKLMAGRLLASLLVTRGEARAVEAATKGQSACEAWYHHRRGRITASSFAKVIDCVNFECRKVSVVKKLLQDIRYPTSTWGLDHEATALDAYKSRISCYHDNLRLTPCGFVISPKFPHLGATPDSWVECACCGVGVVEVKCPFPALSPSSTAKCPFHFLDPHKKATPLCATSLPHDHAYYCQVQGQMAVCDVQYCDFVCWSPNDIHVERILRDKHFFNSIKQDLDSFYECDMIPAILSLGDDIE